MVKERGDSIITILGGLKRDRYFLRVVETEEGEINSSREGIGNSNMIRGTWF